MDTLADLYRTKSDEELLLLSVELDELTDEARDALKAEMSLRRLTADEVEQLRFDRQIDERVKEKRSKASDLLRKRTRFGKRDLVLLDKTKRERFTTTFFIPVAYLPLIPVGTYRIEKLRARWRSKLIVLEKKPLDWEQVLAAWVMSGGIALIAIWVFKLWIRFGAR